MDIRRTILKIRQLGLMGGVKTLYYNFKLFSIRQAIRFPLILSGKTTLKSTKRGAIIFTAKKLHPGILTFGMSHLNYSYSAPNFVKIEGKLIIHGDGNHLFGPGGRLTIRPNGVLEIGNNFSIGHFSCIIISDHSRIGNNNMYSWENMIMDNDSHPIYDEDDKRMNYPKKIIINDNVWIGARCTILKGSEIADGCVIATNSVINKRLTLRNSIYASSRLLKQNIRWESTIV